MRRHPINSPARAPLGFSLALGVLLGTSGVACHASPDEGTAHDTATAGAESARVRTPVRMAPQGASVAIEFESEPAASSTEDLPRVRVSFVLSDDSGGTTRVAVDEFVGSCGEVEAGAGDVLTYQCWFAGGGTKLHTLVEGDDLVVRREELDEMTPEDASAAVEILRFGLAPGAVVNAVP